MSEEAVVTSVASPEQRVAAERMGWIPDTRYKGDPARFVDAEEYITRGETILPIVKEQNKRLQNELETLRGESAKTAAALKAAQSAIDQIEERHSVETQKAVEAARSQLKRQLASASEAGDHEAVAELTDQMVQLNTAEKEAPPIKAEARAEFTAPPIPTDLKEWNEENPWFGTNKRKTALALGIAQELREAGEPAIGRAFYDKVRVEMDKELGVTGEFVGSKVEGARNGESGEAPRQSGRKSFASLPADAKTACDADARNFVGPTKKYKDLNAWRSRYAEIYFEGN